MCLGISSDLVLLLDCLRWKDMLLNCGASETLFEHILKDTSGNDVLQTHKMSM